MSTAIGVGGSVGAIVKPVPVSKMIDASIGAYAVGDVVNDDDCSTTASAWTFPNMVRANGRSGTIIGATIFSESENITPRLTLFLFNATPTGQLTDNSANTSPVSGDRLKYVGQIDFAALDTLCSTGTASTTVTTPSTVGGIPLPFQCGTADTDLYGVLATRDGFTQTATDDITIVLLVEMY